MRYPRKDGSDIIITNQQTPFNGIYKPTIDILIRISDITPSLEKLRNKLAFF